MTSTLHITCFVLLLLGRSCFSIYDVEIPQQPQVDNIYEQALIDAQLESKMQRYRVPSISFAVIRDGSIEWAKGYGVLQKGSDEPVDTETMFSVGSVSKVGASVICLRMVQEGSLDLDVDVNEYLDSWQLPDNEFTTAESVSLRRITSHTAGLTVHGFADYEPDEALPTTTQILTGAKPAKNDPVEVDIPVGSRYRYSGGGTTILQLIVEDITGAPFYQAATEQLFAPLGMHRSSYENPLPASFENVAKAHNRWGRPVALPRGYEAMPEAAASGLWTTPTDLATMMVALMQAYHADDSNFLSPQLVQEQMTPVPPSEFGIGPKISKEGNYTAFSHSGANDSYRALIVGYLENQSGFIILTNGTRGKGLIDQLKPLFTDLLLEE
ncbi:MAG: serine hydrolase domain-containing protein [Verrucomicrobiota bacterium]